MAEATRKIVRRPREDRVREILAAARAVFCERGFAEASISEISARAGVAQGTIYKFFDSKRDLVMAVLDAWYGAMHATFRRELPGITGTRSRLRYIIWRHLEFIRADPELCRLCSNEFRNAGDSYQEALVDFSRHYTGVLVEVLREGMTAGAFRDDIPATLVRDMVFGGLESHVAGFLYRGRALDAESVADNMVALVLGGIAVRPERSDAEAAWLERLERVASRLEAISVRLEPRFTRRKKGGTDD